MSNLGGDIKILEKLGLTAVQSKVYLANFNLGPATAKQISNVARIAREDVYRVMPSLQRLGLTKRHFTKPVMFEAIPPKEAVVFLINRRQQETERICKEADKFLSNCKRNTRNGASVADLEGTVLISGPEATFRRLTAEYRRANYTVDSTINWETHKHGVVRMAGMLNSVINDGLKIRLVMDMPTAEFLCLPKYVQNLFNHPSYMIRYVSGPPKCRVSIFDDSLGFVVPSFVPIATKVPFSFWTENPVLVCLMTEYFENLWESADTIPYQELLDMNKIDEFDLKHHPIYTK